MPPFAMILTFLQAFFKERAELATENLALRQQLAVQQHNAKRPGLKRRDRIFWVWLSRLWPNWRSALLIVKPDTRPVGLVRCFCSWAHSFALRLPSHGRLSSRSCLRLVFALRSLNVERFTYRGLEPL